MDRDEAARKFREADGQFQAQHFGKALDVLNELDAAFPKTPRVLHPKAMCLAKLGRTEEALAICATLIAELNYPKAMGLQQELQRQMQSAPKFNFDVSGLDDILSPTRKRTAPPALPQERDWKPWWIGALIILVVVVLASPLILSMGKGGENSAFVSPSRPANAGVPAESVPAGGDSRTSADTDRTLEEPSGIGWYIASGLAVWGANFCAVFIALAVLHKLPRDGIVDNAGEVAVFSALITVINVVPILGTVAELFIVNRSYDTSCGELVIYFVIKIGTFSVIGFGFAILLLAI